jgi:hypothetical protein
MVQNVERNKVHVSNLAPFYYDANTVDPYEVAVTDAGEFHVEAIVQHFGDPKRKSGMDFEVKWTGYDDPAENTILPWSEVRLLPVLHKYLRDNGMGKLVPKGC